MRRLLRLIAGKITTAAESAEAKALIDGRTAPIDQWRPQLSWNGPVLGGCRVVINNAVRAYELAEREGSLAAFLGRF